MTKEKIQAIYNMKIYQDCPEDDATRRKEGWVKRKVQGVLETPGVVIQTKKQASVQHLGVVAFIMWSRGIGHLRWRPPGPLHTT